MSLEIAWKQNILVTDSNLLKSLLVVFGFGSQAFFCGFSRQNICSVKQDTCPLLYIVIQYHHNFVDISPAVPFSLILLRNMRKVYYFNFNLLIYGFALFTRTHFTEIITSDGLMNIEYV